MRRVIIIIARHLCCILAFALALAIVLGSLLGIRDTGDPRFVDVALALAVICLTLYHLRWLLGLKRAQ